ncbi:hypothetical protein [Acetobacter orientalis]|uniref:hypothetical protein n=1 Tax=Acetobacter orientalis TaxID=146474 RepID=UPI0039EB89A6
MPICCVAQADLTGECGLTGFEAYNADGWVVAGEGGRTVTERKPCYTAFTDERCGATGGRGRSGRSRS